MNTKPNNEEHLIRLETQLAFQENTIEQLNQTVYHLQQEVLKLKEQLNLVSKKLGSLPHYHLASESEETPPPHY